MLVSWLFSAAYPTSGVRSLLSAEGLRWLMGHFSDLLATPLLVWIVLCSIAWGCLSRSCLLHRPTNYRERRAQFMALLLLGIIVGVMVLLTAIPHAVLLSAVGGLWPSPFSAPSTVWCQAALRISLPSMMSCCKVSVRGRLGCCSMCLSFKFMSPSVSCSPKIPYFRYCRFRENPLPLHQVFNHIKYLFSLV